MIQQHSGGQGRETESTRLQELVLTKGNKTCKPPEKSNGRGTTNKRPAPLRAANKDRSPVKHELPCLFQVYPMHILASLPL